MELVPDLTLMKRLESLEALCDELRDLLTFVASSTIINVQIPTKMIEPTSGKPLARQIQGSMLQFYLDARAKGLASLGDIVQHYTKTQDFSNTVPAEKKNHQSAPLIFSE